MKICDFYHMGRRSPHIVTAREGLQNCIDNLNTYTEEWGLQVSLKKKTRCVIFSKGHTNLNLQKHFLLGEKIIQFKDFYKYLGVEISDNCEFSKVRKEDVQKLDQLFS